MYILFPLHQPTLQYLSNATWAQQAAVADCSIFSTERQEDYSDPYDHSAPSTGQLLHPGWNKCCSNFTAQQGRLHLKRQVPWWDRSHCGAVLLPSLEGLLHHLKIWVHHQIFLWLWLSWSWCRRSSWQVWWILGSFQHLGMNGFLSTAFVLLSSTLNQPQNNECFKVSWAGEFSSVNSTKDFRQEEKGKRAPLE